MSQIFTIITTAFAAREYRAAAGISGIELNSTPQNSLNSTIYAPSAQITTRHVTALLKGCDVPFCVCIFNN